MNFVRLKIGFIQKIILSLHPLRKLSDYYRIIINMKSKSHIGFLPQYLFF